MSLWYAFTKATRFQFLFYKTLTVFITRHLAPFHAWHHLMEPMWFWASLAHWYHSFHIPTYAQTSHTGRHHISEPFGYKCFTIMISSIISTIYSNHLSRSKQENIILLIVLRRSNQRCSQQSFQVVFATPRNQARWGLGRISIHTSNLQVVFAMHLALKAKQLCRTTRLAWSRVRHSSVLKGHSQTSTFVAG